jgi:hypothetical protein
LQKAKRCESICRAGFFRDRLEKKPFTPTHFVVQALFPLRIAGVGSSGHSNERLRLWLAAKALFWQLSLPV